MMPTSYSSYFYYNEAIKNEHDSEIHNAAHPFGCELYPMRSGWYRTISSSTDKLKCCYYYDGSDGKIQRGWYSDSAQLEYLKCDDDEGMAELEFDYWVEA